MYTIDYKEVLSDDWKHYASVNLMTFDDIQEECRQESIPIARITGQKTINYLHYGVDIELLTETVLQ